MTSFNRTRPPQAPGEPSASQPFDGSSQSHEQPAATSSAFPVIPVGFHDPPPSSPPDGHVVTSPLAWTSLPSQRLVPTQMSLGDAVAPASASTCAPATAPAAAQAREAAAPLASAPAPSTPSSAPRPPPRQARPTAARLGSTSVGVGTEVREQPPAVRTASEPEPLPPKSPPWMLLGRALSRAIEAVIASGDASAFVQLGIERAAWGFSMGGLQAMQVARLCSTAEQVYGVLRTAQPDDLEALVGDCAALLRTSIPASRRACVSQTELLALAAQLVREPTAGRARRLAAQRLLGWEGLPEAWVDAAIEAALGEAGGLAPRTPRQPRPRLTRASPNA